LWFDLAPDCYKTNRQGLHIWIVNISKVIILDLVLQMKAVFEELPLATVGIQIVFYGWFISDSAVFLRRVLVFSLGDTFF
jgi:hypothetical protein